MICHNFRQPFFMYFNIPHIVFSMHRVYLSCLCNLGQICLSFIKYECIYVDCLIGKEGTFLIFDYLLACECSMFNQCQNQMLCFLLL